MFYTWTPDVCIRAWLLENILEDIKRNLVCVIANSVNVLCITLGTEAEDYITGSGVPLEIRPRKKFQLVCAMFRVGPIETPACLACRYTGPLEQRPTIRERHQRKV
jgi:hypothetical protein